MWKITFFFAQWNFTWTETYYAPLSTNYTALVAQINTLAVLRSAINAAQCTIQTVRVVNLNQPRLTTFVNAGGLQGWPGTFTLLPATDPDQDSAPQFVALQVKFFGANLHVCRRYLSGLPEGIIGTKFGGRNLGSPGLEINAISAFVGGLSAYGWSFRYTNQANKQICTGLSQPAQANGNIAVSFNQQMVAPVAGQPIYMVLRGFRRVNYRQFGLGGTYNVDAGSPGITAAVAPFTYYLQNTSNISLSNINVKGYGVQLLYGYDSFSASGGPGGTGYNILSGNHRKRGASALALRGRSRSKP